MMRGINVLNIFIAFLMCIGFVSANVVINEFLADAQAPEQQNEWIELYYDGLDSINLSGWYFNDSSTTPGDSLSGILNSSQRYITFNGTQSGISLNNCPTCDSIYLHNSSGDLIDSITYTTTNENESEGRKHDGFPLPSIKFSTPTKGLTNNIIPTGSLSNQTIVQGILGSFNISKNITDADGDSLVYSVVGENESQINCSVVGNDNITFIGSTSWTGIANCVIQINDSYSLTNKTFYIEVTPSNYAPNISSTLTNISFDEDSYSLTNLSDYVVDEDLDENITWSSSSASNLIIKINQTTKILNVSADSNWNGQRNITLTATDKGGLSSSVNVTVEVISQPDAPVLQNITNKSAVQDKEISINILPLVSDADLNDNLTFSSAGVGSINSTTGLFRWTPDYSNYGWYAVNFTVNDSFGLQDSKIAYIRVYSTLNISNVEIKVNGVSRGNIPEEQVVQNVKPGDIITTFVTIQNSGSATNIDNVNTTIWDSLNIYSDKIFAPLLASGSSVTNSFNFTVPTIVAESIYHINMNSSGHDHNPPQSQRYSYYAYNLNVSKDVDDLIIERASLDNNSVQCTSPVILTVNLTNKGLIDQTDANVSVTNSALGLNVYNSSIFAVANSSVSLPYVIDTSAKRAGNYTINVLLKYYANTISKNTTANLEIKNCAPQLIGSISDVIFNEESYNDTINLSLYFSDYNNDTLAYNAAGNISNLNFAYLSNGLVNISSTLNHFGIHTINFTARDINGATNTSNNLNVNILNVNDAPTISVDNQNFEENVTKSFYITANDVDPSNTLTITTNASFASFGGLSALNTTSPAAYSLFNWTPQHADIGVYNILFSVSDDSGLSANKTVIISVGNANHAPVLNTVAGSPFSVNESEKIVFTLSASDMDLDVGDSLTYSCNLSALNVQKINNTLANVTWVPSSSYIGNNFVNCTVTDSHLAKDSKMLEIDVISQHVNFIPADTNPVVNGRFDYTFRFEPDAGITCSNIIWKENGNNTQNGSLSYTFGAKFTSLTYNVRVEMGCSNGVNYTHDWYPKSTMYPVATPYSTTPDLSTLNQTQLQNVNLTVINGNSKIQFLEPMDLSNLATIGNNVYINGPIAAVNGSGNYFVLNKPAIITLTGLTYSQEPKILYYSGGFTTDPSQITSECPNSICQIMSRTNYPTTSGVVVFNVTRFSSYMVNASGGSGINPPINQTPLPGTGALELDLDISEDEPKPDEKVTIEVQVENTGDLDIEDIDLIIELRDENGNVIEDTDGDDMEDDDNFDLDSDDDITSTFTFTMPLDAEDGDEYTVYVKACGDDENNKEECALDDSETIKIQREKHEVLIESATISPSSINCFNSADVSIDLKNIGQKDEDVKVSVLSDVLGLSDSQTIELEAEDEDNYEKSVNFAVAAPKDLAEGTYNINIKAEYSGKTATKTLSLVKGACLEQLPEEIEQTAEQNLVVVTLDKNTVVTGPAPDKVNAPTASNFRESFEYFILLIILGIAALGIVVFLIGAMIIRS